MYTLLFLFHFLLFSCSFMSVSCADIDTVTDAELEEFMTHELEFMNQVVEDQPSHSMMEQQPLLSQTKCDAAAFAAFKKQYKKTYASPAEQQKRLAIFQQNCRVAKQTAAKSGKPFDHMGRFNDETPAEFRLRLGAKPRTVVKNSLKLSPIVGKPAPPRGNIKQTKTKQRAKTISKAPVSKSRTTVRKVSSSSKVLEPSKQTSVPGSPNGTGGVSTAAVASKLTVLNAPDIDWRALGAVGPVRTQAKCGSCWAMTTAQTLESNIAVKSKKPVVPLSPQQLIDCDHTNDNNGCKGGNVCNCGNFYLNAHGLASESNYPYMAMAGVCNAARTNIKPQISSWDLVLPLCTDSCTNQNEDLIAQAVQHGPLAAVIDATYMAPYRGGMVRAGVGCRSDFPGLNHAVLIVGLGTNPDTKQRFWIMKNHWGESWGEGGYMRMVAGSNTCGIAAFVTHPTLL